MKKLEKIIKEAILEVLAEADISGPEKAAKDAELNAINKKIAALNAKKSDLASGREEITETNIDEMARISIKYKIGDLSKLDDLSDKVKNSKGVQGIIDYLQSNEEASVAQIAKEKFDRPQQAINPVVQSLVASGVLEPVGGTGIAASRVDTKTGNVAPPTTKQRLEPEDFAVGKGNFDRPAFEPSDEEVAASFARARAAGDGEDEFVANLKKDAPKIKPSISDEDYDKLMKFLDYKERLRKIDSALRQNKKISRGGDDMISKDRGEAEKLSNMKTNLEQRIEDLVAGSEYLQRRKAPEDKNKNR
jgi:hypothetical protein